METGKESGRSDRSGKDLSGDRCSSAGFEDASEVVLCLLETDLSRFADCPDEGKLLQLLTPLLDIGRFPLTLGSPAVTVSLPTQPNILRAVHT